MQRKVDYPLKVYKYRNWSCEKHRTILLENELFFTSPKDFNDPFDYKVAEDFSLLDTKEKIDAYIDKTRKEQEKNIPKVELEQKLGKLKYRLTNEPQKVQEEYNNLYFEGVNNYKGVLSLSERWDSILMWSHYGDSHKGFCVGFWEEKLRTKLIVSGGKVFYPLDEQIPSIDPLKDFLPNMFKESHTKSKDWSYEEEYRLVKEFYPVIPNVENRKQKFENNFIAEIIVGLSASDDTKQNIIDLGRLKSVPVYQCIKVASKFALDRQLLT